MNIRTFPSKILASEEKAAIAMEYSSKEELHGIQVNKHYELFSY